MKYNPNPPIYVDEHYPELIKYFQNPKDAHVGKSHPNKINMVCPCCHKVHSMYVGCLIRSGRVSCPTCSDGFSYPERFMANILRNINIDFIYQFQDDWCKNYRYDFMIETKDTKYLIEMDGGIGHGNKVVYDGQTKEESLLADSEKDILAQDNGYVIIRVDCNYVSNRYEYIKNNIINQLENVIDLSKVDWEYCNKMSLDSLFFRVIDCYRSKTKFADEISEYTGVSTSTVLQYLRRAINNKILEKELIVKNNPFKSIPTNTDVEIIYKHENLNNSKLLYCYDDNIIFGSVTDAIEYYQYETKGLYIALSTKDGYYLGKHFEYVENLPKDFQYKRRESITNRHYKIYQYTKDKSKLIATYNSSNIPKEYVYSNIWRVCTNKRKSAYGYFWSYTELPQVI